MDTSLLEQQIKKIQDKVVDNVDKHFNQYISEDLQEINDDEYYLIDSASWLIYWMERLGELKPIQWYRRIQIHWHFISQSLILPTCNANTDPRALLFPGPY